MAKVLLYVVQCSTNIRDNVQNMSEAITNNTIIQVNMHTSLLQSKIICK